MTQDFGQTGINAFSNVIGRPFVTLGNGGGFDFGPLQNPTDTFYGLQAAIAAVTNASYAHYGAEIWCYLNGACNVTGTITINTPVTIKVWVSKGGVGDPASVVLPTGYFNYIGAGGAAVDIIYINASNTRTENLPVVCSTGVTNIQSCVHVDACRSVEMVSLFINDQNAATAAVASHVGLLWSASNKTSDGCRWDNLVAFAALPLQIGLAADSGGTNDSQFIKYQLNGPGFNCDTTTNCLVYNYNGNNIQMSNDS